MIAPTLKKEGPMNNKNRGRRGATLAELAIVIAVIAIVAVMVTSFIVMIDGSRDISQMKLEAMQDIVLAESVIENFINDAYNNQTNTGITNCKGSTMTSKAGDTLSFGAGALFINRTGGESNNVRIELETVKSITFKAYDENLSAADNIFYCTITYNVGGESNLDYTFCVNPYAGENIKEVTP
jgi:Tfp pilus assembly protein FimT